MRKSEATIIITSFLHNHLTAGDFWNDESYIKECEALYTLGYARKQCANCNQQWRMCNCGNPEPKYLP